MHLRKHVFKSIFVPHTQEIATILFLFFYKKFYKIRPPLPSFFVIRNAQKYLANDNYHKVERMGKKQRLVKLKLPTQFSPQIAHPIIWHASLCSFGLIFLLCKQKASYLNYKLSISEAFSSICFTQTPISHIHKWVHGRCKQIKMS